MLLLANLFLARSTWNVCSTWIQIIYAHKKYSRQHTTEYYGSEANYADKQVIIGKKYLRSNILILWIRNLLTTDENLNVRGFKISYNFNGQEGGSEMFFVI